ncbi:MAG TPA: enoyl-CoA hydratase-related protein [Acidimicrobiales bacterium]|nr:enoyl-CoA hydratase-related protein [Acidimicrobiales bacterium]
MFHDRGVTTLRLVDVERRNALSATMLRELVGAIDAAEADAASRVVVLTNAGNTFCAGADLRERVDGLPTPRLDELFTRVARSRLVFVGRIDGHCVAGGVGLAAVLDISIAREDATFGFSEVRLGLAPAIISVVCLAKMRDADARSAMLRGNRFDAREAARMGLVTSAVPAGELDAALDSVVADLLAGEPNALAETKELLRRVPGMVTDDAFRHASEVSARLFASDAAREGMSAFLEKRPARWSNDASD